MIRLSREIRFSLSPQTTERAANSWSGWPATTLVAPFLVMRCEVSGEPDGQTGYLCNIKEIDTLLRGIVTDRLIPEFSPGQCVEELLATTFAEAQKRWARNPSSAKAAVCSLTIDASPFLSFSIDSESPDMISMTQQFEFSAAHRLHCDELSDEENRELFGKCNNPNGHGHNYVLSVTLKGKPAADSGMLISLDQFEATVKELIVDRLDHKHLNEDLEYFSENIPSVENIAIAIWKWLDGQFGEAGLECVRVYETPKTWAEYRGGAQ